MIKYLDTRLIRAIAGDKHADEIERSFPAMIGTPNGFADWTQDDQEIYLEAQALEIPFSQLWTAKWEARTLPGEDRSLFTARLGAK